MLQKRLLKGAGRVVPALVVLMAITAGCARAPVSGVSVKSLAADLVFGIPELPEAAPPPNTDLSPDNPIGVISTGGRGPTFQGGPPPVPPPDCAKAEPTDFPEQEAGTVVQGSPKEGFYKWVVNKKQVLSTGGEISDITFVERSIDDVGIVGGSLRFTTVERDLVFGAERIVRQTYEVRQGPGQDEGIYLIMRKSQSGNAQSTFEPVPPIQILDIPIRPGATLNSTGVDPNSLEVQQHEGTILPRRRYDACGKLVDAWFVDAQQTFTNRRGERVERNYDYSIAPQLGGIIVFEHIDAPRTNPQLRIDATIGQLEPSATSQLR